MEQPQPASKLLFFLFKAGYRVRKARGRAVHCHAKGSAVLGARCIRAWGNASRHRPDDQVLAPLLLFQPLFGFVDPLSLRCSDRRKSG